MTRRIRNVRNAILLGTTALFSTAAAGCFGRFPAVSAVYGFNKSASSNGVVRSLLMVAMIIIPVYAVASLVDILVLNVVDFFNGVHVASKTQTLADGSTIELTRTGPDSVHVRRVDLAGHEQTFEIVRVGDKAGYVRGEDGRMLGMVEQLPDGQIVRRSP
jgi:hypothetical protein